MGTVKRRVQPEDVTLNVGSAGVVPPCPIPGHAWKRVVHDPTVTWLAFWKENVMGATKYVFLSAASSFKGKSDLAKYEKVRGRAGGRCWLLPAAPACSACLQRLAPADSLVVSASPRWASSDWLGAAAGAASRACAPACARQLSTLPPPAT